MASFPTSIWSPTTKNTSDVIQPAHINDAQSEIVAMESAGLTVGTFTPILQFGGATTGITYGTQSGSYVKFGRLVIAEVTIVLTSKGSATGSATVTGLPTSALNAIAAFVDPVASFSSLTGAVLAGVSGTTANLLQTSATGRAAIDNTNFGNTTSFRMTVVYISAS